MGTPEEEQATAGALEGASGYLRHELAGRIDLRYVPELFFRHDRSIASGDRIARLLDDIGQEQKPTPC